MAVLLVLAVTLSERLIAPWAHEPEEEHMKRRTLIGLLAAMAVPWVGITACGSSSKSSSSAASAAAATSSAAVAPPSRPKEQVRR